MGTVNAPKTSSFLSDLKPYPMYKDSGVPWLRRLPAYWGVAAVKRYYSVQLGKMLQTRPQSPQDIELPYLKAQNVQWFRVRTDNVSKMWGHPREIKQYGVLPGDLLVCEGGEGGRCGIVRGVPTPCIIQNALHRVRPLGGSSNSFLQYVMYVAAVRGWFEAINEKATIAHFTREKLAAFVIPQPPVNEQAAIVRLLDHVDRRIRRYIRAKQKLIKLLEEQKQVIIHRAVTRGLDPNVRLKPSGVQWLGDVPEHWQVRRLKTLSVMRSGEGISAMSIEPQGQYPVYGGNGVRGYTSNYSHDGDFALIGRQGALCGNVHVVHGKFWASEHAIVASLRPGHVLEWFSAALVAMNLNQYSMAAAQPGLAVDRILNLSLAVPPAEEQALIAEYIDRRTAGITKAIAAAEREISLLREYRTRLISDVVTGKLDVREAAANLPAEAEEPEPLDEGHELGETDMEEDQADEFDAFLEEVEA